MPKSFQKISANDLLNCLLELFSYMTFSLHVLEQDFEYEQCGL